MIAIHVFFLFVVPLMSNCYCFSVNCLYICLCSLIFALAKSIVLCLYVNKIYCIVLYCITKFRTAMTKLRVSYYRLEVETGRWSRPVSNPFDERKCHICNKLEDEFHFRFECPLYTDLRRQYLSRYYIVRPSMYKLIKPLKKLMLKSVLEIYQYIFKAFQLRQNTIYIEMWLNYFLFWISM